MDFTRGPAFTFKAFVHVDLGLLVLLGRYNHATSDVLFCHHSGVFGHRRLVFTRPFLSCFKFHQTLVVVGDVFVSIWGALRLGVGLEQAKVEKIAIAALISLLPSCLFGQWKFAHLRHGDEKAHLTLVQPDAGARAVLVKQGLSPKLGLPLLPISVQQVDTESSQTEAGAEGDGVNHDPVSVLAP